VTTLAAPVTDTTRTLLDRKLLLVTGKGGTGKTTYASALALIARAKGKRVLLVELDSQRPALTPVFGVDPGYQPVEVLDGLDVCNLTWEHALQQFIEGVVPAGRVASLVLQNKLVYRFLDFTPGSQEIVTLSALTDHVRPRSGKHQYDLVIADLPATGHAFSLLDITRSALGLFRSGPVRERATEMRAMITAPTTQLVLVALPEEMVVNETIETIEKFRKYELLSQQPAIFLNRATLPTLSADERALLSRLSEQPLDATAREFVRAGRWEDELEQGTEASSARLREALGIFPVLVPPAPPGGVARAVTESVAVHLGRQVGVGRKDLQFEHHPEPAAPPAADTAPRSVDMRAWLARTQLVVCVGAGGVGKTTTAATLALTGALSGRKTVVLTIDPARRLANSLGLQSFGNEEKKIDLAALGHGDATGELYAMMLDSRSTFDSLIARIAADEAAKERILKNHVYRHMSDTFAGSQDYMATEKLYDLVAAGRYDLVVLDTPPVKNALDFLEAPGRLIHFLDERVMAWFVDPPGSNRVFGRRILMGTTAVVYKLLGYVFGQDFVDDLTQFFSDFQGLYEGFVERHEQVLKLFRTDTTSFVTVCAPTESSLDVATFFQQELAARRLPRGGVVVNQVHTCETDTHDAKAALGAVAAGLAADLPASAVPSLLARLGMAHRRLHALRVAEAGLTGRVRAAAKGGGFYQEVPRLEGNVHDLEALSTVSGHLMAAARAL
jgi:anion-transporting  ArsA/GET3 family ATPase